MARSRYRDSSRPLAGFIRSLLLRLVGEVVDISNREIDQSTVQLGMGSVTAFHMFNDIAKGKS